MTIQTVMNRINSPEALRIFTLLYGEEPEVISMQKERYGRALEAFLKAFPDRQEVQLFSAPGRTEIGGNHTDHQHGCALGEGGAATRVRERSHLTALSEYGERRRQQSYAEFTAIDDKVFYQGLVYVPGYFSPKMKKHGCA